MWSESNVMRNYLNIMRGFQNETNNKQRTDIDTRNLLKITRKLRLNEIDDSKGIGDNMKSPNDQKNQESKMLRIFDNMPNNESVSVTFFDLYVYDKLVYFGGVVDGTIEFTYQVTPDEKESGVSFDYLPDFVPDNPKNDEIINRIENYYNTFSEYWRNEILNDYSGD